MLSDKLWMRNGHMESFSDVLVYLSDYDLRDIQIIGLQVRILLIRLI